MGGGGIIGSFLDEAAIDEFIIAVVPTFIGKVFPFLHPGIVTWRSASCTTIFGRRRSVALRGAAVMGLSQPYGRAAGTPFHHRPLS